MSRALIVGLILGVAGCCQQPARPTVASVPVPDLYATQQAIADYVDSGRYDAEVTEVVAQARAWLEQRAQELGVAVFFITGRSDALQAPTEQNLRDQGYAFTRVILRPAGRFTGTVEYKSFYRCEIEREGYTVLLTLGDQQSDLDGGCAERGFKLPNPVYFLP